MTHIDTQYPESMKIQSHTQRSEIGCWNVRSSTKPVPRLNFTARKSSEIPGLVEASIQGQWAFGSTRGTSLLTAHPHSSYMLGDTLLKHLAEVQALNDMFLVTEVLIFIEWARVSLHAGPNPNIHYA